jgi:hypothetical protein
VFAVNQIMAQQTEAWCKFCHERHGLEQKYLADIHE